MTAQAGDTLIPESAACVKAALRLTQRRLRKAIPLNQRVAAARKAARFLLRRLRARSDIAIYLSVRSELSTSPLCVALMAAGHRVYAPMTLREHRMRFVRLRRHTVLRRSSLGLPQPAAARASRPLRRLDTVLLPLLAFDARGARLGNGGGYYDRALAGPRIGKRPWRVGYAYAAQEVGNCPCEEFDARLDAVVTERGLRRFDRLLIRQLP